MKLARPAAAVVALALLTACGSASPSNPGTNTSPASTVDMTPAKLTVQDRWYSNVQFAGSFVAQAKGYYKDQNLTVTELPGGPGKASEPLLEQGTVDVGITALETTGNAVKNGAKLTIIGTLYQVTPAAIISLPKDPIRTPADLKGKKIGVTTGSTPSLIAWLKTQHINETDLEIVPIQGAMDPLITGQVSAIFGSRPNGGVALQQAGYQPVYLSPADHGGNEADMAYTVRTADLQDPAKRAALVRFMAAEILGWQYTIAHVQEATDITLAGPGKDLGLDPKQQLLQAQEDNRLIQPTPDTKIFGMPTDLVDQSRKTLAAAGETISADLFDSSVLDEAYALLARQKK